MECHLSFYEYISERSSIITLPLLSLVIDTGDILLYIARAVRDVTRNGAPHRETIAR